MGKVLAKALKDAVKEKRIVIGSREVADSAQESDMMIISRSGPQALLDTAQNGDIPVLEFEGTSVALGKLCGLQFRVSALSLVKTDNSIVQSILKENEQAGS